MERVRKKMVEHSNEYLVRNLFDAFQRGDVVTIYASMAEDAVWHFPGRKGQLAGDHKGREAIFAFLAKPAALTGGFFTVELIDVLANDENAVAIYRAIGERDGRELNNPTCLRMRIEDGKIVEFWEFVWDVYQDDEFWA
jgi:ketosteroid isomerase-like protein